MGRCFLEQVQAEQDMVQTTKMPRAVTAEADGLHLMPVDLAAEAAAVKAHITMMVRKMVNLQAMDIRAM